MARVTVEDCIVKVPNRFDLVLLSAQRARQVSAGAQLTVDRDNDKNPVVALREIAESTVDQEALKNAVISGLQKHVEVDEPEEDEFSEMEMLASMSAPGEAPVEAAEPAESEDDTPEDDTPENDMPEDDTVSAADGDEQD